MTVNHWRSSLQRVLHKLVTIANHPFPLQSEKIHTILRQFTATKTQTGSFTYRTVRHRQEEETPSTTFQTIKLLLNMTISPCGASPTPRTILSYTSQGLFSKTGSTSFMGCGKNMKMRKVLPPPPN